jgi:hypothetical protein
MEVTFERRCIGRTPDTRTLQCQSISERPAEYTYRKAADGGVMRSEIERAALVLKGINLHDFEALGWEPTHLAFKDDKTGELKELLVRRRDTLEPETLMFGIDGRLYASPAA